MLTQDLEKAEGTYKRLGAKLVVGMPFKDIATSDTLLMHTVPPKDDVAGRRALKRLQVRAHCCSRLALSDGFIKESLFKLQASSSFTVACF